jgi:hypothetical protein
MIDVNVLRGSSVREADTSGRILSVSLPWVKISWEDEDSLIPRVESLLRSNPRLHDDIEIHTLTEGWVKLGSLVGSRPRGRTSIIQEMRALAEASQHNPFTHQSAIGPSAVSWAKNRSVKKKGDWVCKCGGYKCKCKKTKAKKGTKKTKTITIKPGYKKKYNRDYRKSLK